MPSFAYFVLLAAAALLMGLRFIQLRGALLRARAGEQRFRLLAEHAVDAGFLVDCASLKLLYVSPVASRLSGYDQAELEAMAAELLADLPARLQRLRGGDASRLHLVRQFERQHQDGRVLPLEIVSTLVCDAAGHPVSLVGVLRDITARRDQEAAQKRFASMLSHEFRSPLATIDGAIQNLEIHAGSADEATRKRYHKIQTAVDRLLALIDEYLTPQRMASIGRERQPNGIAPKALLDAAAAQGGTPDHPVSVSIEGLPGHLRCDPDGMRMCLQVLLDNARHYAPAGTTIELNGRPAPQGGIELTVADHGPGVHEDDMPRLFDKFFRGRNAGASAGSGLGLYMARAVVEVHGGTLSVSNRPEGGAIFRIWLPFQAETGKSLA
ncbi:PAS domain-containing sensor histidine kinase [Janthinobacterium agaricidamnosum]|uniref:histidine kinase n=1 Tax=Janthinobacterium agaricidamnosum NBRC 102515 = DSM 9628 TaxID=1349767 RepID=W0V0B5_9BURK|nr:PAS domain-containing sensor histidine kinase [Janthinobacterium agaricidamnosum]CDG80722.1 sensory box protein [Janthinobacterium agaricidamnosum NBRC 102515 = DSM 9628]